VSAPLDNQLPILVVDDDEATLVVLRGVLEHAGYANVETTSDPCRVPELFANTRPKLVLMDLHMPQIEGLDLMEQLKAMTDERSSVPFLVLTADESDATKRRALSLGARDFLTKPVDRVELLLRVRNLLRVQQVQDGLFEQNAQLERQRLGLLRDLQTMQAALVPEISSRLGGLAVSVAYRPAEGPAAGGDFYDVFAPRPGEVAIMLGDVAGHGREALAHAALTRYTLRAYLQAGLEPRAALATAGRVLVDDTGERHVTVAVGVYDSRTATLTYALAGHPPPLMVGPEHPPRAEPLTVCSSPPIGWGIATGRRQTRVSLAPGGAVCFFSDGLIEARRNGQLLGRTGLHEILAALGPHAQAERLLQEVRDEADCIPDDMVACVLTPQAIACERRVHIEQLEVDAHTLARSSVRRFLRRCALGQRQIACALERATDMVAASGAALLEVHFEPAGPRIEVSAPAGAASQG
jgi:phosphoserine phosphatase RsbU/P